MRSSYKTIGLWVVLIILFVAFYRVFSKDGEDISDITYSQFQKKVAEHKIGAVIIKGKLYTGEFVDSKEKFRATGPVADATMLKELRDANVDVKFEAEEQNGILADHLHPVDSDRAACSSSSSSSCASCRAAAARR